MISYFIAYKAYSLSDEKRNGKTKTRVAIQAATGCRPNVPNVVQITHTLPQKDDDH